MSSDDSRPICAHPELRKEPGECSAEQRRKCHGDLEKQSCEKGKKAGECSPEQIRDCHGDAKKHPCEKGAYKVS